MNKKICKRIIGLFIFALTIMLFGITTVYAKTCDEVKTFLNTKADANDRYGLTMTFDIKTMKYIISVNTTEKVAKKIGLDRSKVQFKVVGAYTYKPTTEGGQDLQDKNGIVDLSRTEDISKVFPYIGKVIKNGKTLSIPRDSVFTNGKDGFAVKLEPVGFNDPELEEACKDQKTSFFAVVNVDVEIGEDLPIVIYYGDNTPKPTTTMPKKVDCKNMASVVEKYGKNSFEYNYCVDLNEAESKTSTRVYDIEEKTINEGDEFGGGIIKYQKGTKTKVTDPMNFRCAYDDLVTGTPKDDSEYYVNKEFLIGKGYITINMGNYQYSAKSEYSSTKIKAATCKLECTEVVKVEYGAPVATAGGLCFEYKVKVTSRTNCEMANEPTPPPDHVVCTPTPYCWHPGNHVYVMGGPSEDFDNCILACDGGKYTDKCTNKCYKEVYGKSIARKTTGEEISYADVQQMVKTKAGLSYYLKNGEIVWGPVGSYRAATSWGGGYVATDSYWHLNHSWGYSGSWYDQYQKGIPKREGCEGTCSWKRNSSPACNNDENYRYLNHPDVVGSKAYTNDKKINAGENERGTYIGSDGKEHDSIYKRLYARCSAYAACNTTVTEFTISADYKLKGEGEETKTYYFPYTPNNDKNTKDTIKSKEGEHVSASCPTGKNSIILASEGCYNCGEIKQKMEYMTEWSFPGSWINNKTYEISYVPVTDEGWREKNDKFCLPFNIENVNKNWYNYYYATVNVATSSSYTYDDPNYITNITCPDGTKIKNVCEYKNSKYTEQDAKSIEEGGITDYNIKATTRGFGMFEWDIDIECFYAVNDLFPKVEENDDCSKLTCCQPGDPGCDSSEKERVRTVDLKNVFPDSEGNTLKSPDTTGRTVPFNWSAYAEQTKKDPDYVSRPSNYLVWIQTMGTDIYSDPYLDYEIVLTKESITKIKSQFRTELKSSYTEWPGDVKVNSVTNYKSALIRDGGILNQDSKYPGNEALKCNNIGQHTIGKNYTAPCDDFSKVKEGN